MLSSIYATKVFSKDVWFLCWDIHETRVLVQWFSNCLSPASSHLQLNIRNHWIKVDYWLNLLKTQFVLLARIASYHELMIWFCKEEDLRNNSNNYFWFQIDSSVRSAIHSYEFAFEFKIYKRTIFSRYLILTWRLFMKIWDRILKFINRFIIRN